MNFVHKRQIEEIIDLNDHNFNQDYLNGEFSYSNPIIDEINE